MAWPDKKYEQACSFSVFLHGNKHVFPAALWIAEQASESCKATEVGVGLSGKVAPNILLNALDRLCAIGALRELPYPGRPHPRIFERQQSPYWDFVHSCGAQLEKWAVTATPRAKRR